MARISEQADKRPLGDQRSWARTNGTFLAGQAHIDGADRMAIEMEAKWGAGRLRLLVSDELREKFDRQRFLFNAAVWHGDLEELRQQSGRMVKAWQALDRAAEAAGASKLNPLVWELTLADGTVVALLRDLEAHRLVDTSGRRVVTYTLDEIGRMLDNYRAVTEVKAAFPGAKVEKIRQAIDDPLNSIRDGKTLEETFDGGTADFAC